MSSTAKRSRLGAVATILGATWFVMVAGVQPANAAGDPYTGMQISS